MRWLVQKFLNIGVAGMATEKQIESAILDYLNILPEAKFWKVDCTGIFDPKKGVFRQKRSKHRYKGVSDIIGFYRGRFIAIEVKTPSRRKKTTVEQEEFLEAAASNGQIAIVACSVQEVANVLVKL